MNNNCDVDVVDDDDDHHHHDDHDDDHYWPFRSCVGNWGGFQI